VTEEANRSPATRHEGEKVVPLSQEPLGSNVRRARVDATDAARGLARNGRGLYRERITRSGKHYESATGLHNLRTRRCRVGMLCAKDDPFESAQSNASRPWQNCTFEFDTLCLSPPGAHAFTGMQRVSFFGEFALRKPSANCLANKKLARSMWGKLPQHTIHMLEQLTRKTGVSIADGDLRLLDGRWYVTHTGLLRIAHRRRCLGIRTAVERELSDPINNRWVCKAIVHRDPSSKGFVGYGRCGSDECVFFRARIGVAYCRDPRRQPGPA